MPPVKKVESVTGSMNLDTKVALLIACILISFYLEHITDRIC